MADYLKCKTALSLKKILKPFWLRYQDIECPQSKTIHQHKFKKLNYYICMFGYNTIYCKFSDELFSWRTSFKIFSCFNNSFHIFIFFKCFK